MAGEISWPTWVEIMTNISHLLTCFNSSVNFYIYLAKHYKNICSCPQGQRQNQSFFSAAVTRAGLRKRSNGGANRQQMELMEIEVEPHTTMQETTMSLLSANGGTPRHCSSPSSSTNSNGKARGRENVITNIIVNANSDELANPEIELSLCKENV